MENNLSLNDKEYWIGLERKRIETYFYYIFPKDYKEEEYHVCWEKLKDVDHNANILLSYSTGTYKKFARVLVTNVYEKDYEKCRYTEMITEDDILIIDSGKHNMYDSLSGLLIEKYLLINLGLLNTGDKKIPRLVTNIVNLRYIEGKSTWIMVKQPIDYFDEIQQLAREYNFLEFPFEDKKKIVHSDDFSFLNIDGETYEFTPPQALIIKFLYENDYLEKKYTPYGIKLKIIKDRTGITSALMRDAFQKHPAWKKLIVSRKKGYYSLNI